MTTLPSATLTEVPPTGQVAPTAPADVAVYLGVATNGAMSALPFGAQNLTGWAATYVNGPLAREGGYMMAKTPVQCVGYRLPITQIAATTSTPVITANVSSNFTAVASGTPTDGVDAIITFGTVGGVTGTGPIAYTVSTDGGVTTGTVQALGTATSITIAGVSIALGSGKTVTAGDTIAFWTQPASATILPTTITRVASSTATMVFSGTPNDGYDIQVVYPTGGTVGVAGITLTYSLDGGLTTVGPVALPLNGVFVIPDGAGSTGITLTVGAGTVTALDQVVAKTTPPGYQFSDVQAAMNAIRDSKLTWSFFVLTGHSTRAMRDSVEALLQTYATNGRFTWASCPARGMITGERTTSPNNTTGDLAWSNRLLAEWGTSVGNRTPPIAGSCRVTCPMTGRQNRRPVTLALIPRIIGISADTDPGDRTLPNAGAVSSDILIHSPTTGALADHDARLNPSLFNLGFNVLRTWYGEEGLEPGVFPAGGRLMSASTDIQRWQHRRILNLADAASLTAMAKLILSKFGINPATARAPLNPGDIQPWALRNIQQQLFLAVLAAVGNLVSNPRQGGITVTVTPTPGLVGGNTVVFQNTQLVWKDYIDQFQGTIGFVNPAFAALTQAA